MIYKLKDIVKMEKNAKMQLEKKKVAVLIHNMGS
jgi:hypothetical protein